MTKKTLIEDKLKKLYAAAFVEEVVIRYNPHTQFKESIEQWVITHRANCKSETGRVCGCLRDGELERMVKAGQMWIARVETVQESDVYYEVIAAELSDCLDVLVKDIEEDTRDVRQDSH